MKNCKHKPTPISTEETAGRAVTWNWCIRCGALFLEGMTFFPGSHQRKTIIAEEDRNSKSKKKEDKIPVLRIYGATEE